MIRRVLRSWLKIGTSKRYVSREGIQRLAERGASSDLLKAATRHSAPHFKP